jgi:pSer/pThr/pTyr-binding forkhead associated (FHA) protein
MTTWLIVQHDPAGRQAPAALAAQRLRLDRGLLTIGRGQDCDLVLQDTLASRHHAELRRQGDQWLVVDLGSTNGTFVGGLRLRPNEARLLPPGALLQIGDTHLTLQQEPSPSSVSQQPSQQPAPIQYQEPSIQNYHPERSEGPESRIQNPFVWLARLLVALGSALLIVGSFLPWVRVEVTLPVLGRILNQAYTGLDSGQAGLFIGVGVMALLLVGVDVAVRHPRSGLAVGSGQALAGVVGAATAATSAYRYYQVGTQEFLGISLVDVLTNYLSDQVHISVQFGIYLAVVGLVIVIVGGLLRLLSAVRA